MGRYVLKRLALSLVTLVLVSIIVFLIASVLLGDVGWSTATASVPTLSPVDWLRQLLLPPIPLMFILFGYIPRMARAGTIDALQPPYTRTAVLKGLPRRTVITHHVLRNSLLPTI